MKNIIITGTSRGIGLELALQFANAGHTVIALSRNIPQILIENNKYTPIKYNTVWKLINRILRKFSILKTA